MEDFLNQPFSQPKSVMLKAIEKYRSSTSDLVRGLRSDVIRSIQLLDDSVLNLCLGSCRPAYLLTTSLRRVLNPS